MFWFTLTSRHWTHDSEWFNQFNWSSQYMQMYKMSNVPWISGPSFTLPEGLTSYEFSFNLKAELPSSFSGGSGKIKYKMEFTVDKPWKFDEKQTIVLNIIQTVNLNYLSGTLLPFENQLTRNIGYIGSGPISVHIFIRKCGFIHGDKIPIQVHWQRTFSFIKQLSLSHFYLFILQAIVTNHSKVHVEKMKFALNKIIDYHSKTPGLAIKREVHRLLKKEAGGVSKKTEQRYEHVIEVPTTAPSQDSNTSRLIHIKYELKVEAKLGGLYKNLVTTVPITVGNIPHSMDDPVPPDFPSLPDLPPGLTLGIPPAPGFDVRRLSMSSNLSFHLVSDSSRNDSTVSSHRSSIQIHSNSSAPINMTNSSVGSLSRNSSSSTQNVSSNSEYQPSAPPMDLNSPTTSATIRPATVYMDAPPSYDEVFGSPSSSTFNQSNFSNSSALFNASIART